MNSLLIVSCASIILTLLVTIFAAQLGAALNVIDSPDSARKLHTNATPLVGGLAFFVSFLAVFLYMGVNPTTGYPGNTPLVLGALMYFGVGFVDDRSHVNAALRLLILGIVGAAVSLAEPMFMLRDLAFHSIDVDVPLGIFAVPFTVFTLLCFQNGANMADGVNGLLLGLTLVWIALLSPWLHGGFILYFSSIGTVALTLLIPNIRGRLFCGDSGAYVVAFLVCMGVISLYNSYEGQLPAEYMAIAFLLPVLDMGRVMMTRLFRGEHPFDAAKDHIHHLLIDLTGRRTTAVLMYLALNLAPILYPLIDGLSILVPLTIQIGGYAAILIVHARTAPQHKSP